MAAAPQANGERHSFGDAKDFAPFASFFFAPSREIPFFFPASDPPTAPPLLQFGPPLLGRRRNDRPLRHP